MKLGDKKIRNVTTIHALSKLCDIPSKSVNRLLKPSGHYMYRQFNIQQFYVLPTQSIYVYCVDLRTKSDYFPIQHYNRDLTL